MPRLAGCEKIFVRFVVLPRGAIFRRRQAQLEWRQGYHEASLAEKYPSDKKKV